jgi:hypothetical protein
MIYNHSSEEGEYFSSAYFIISPILPAQPIVIVYLLSDYYTSDLSYLAYYKFLKIHIFTIAYI